MTAEKPAPSRKKTDRPTRIPVSPGSRKSSPNTTAAKSTRVRNIRLRYAAAPSWTAWAISCIRGVPSCAASTCRRRTTAKASEATAMTAITLTVTRLEAPSEGIRPPMRRCRHGIAAAGARPPVPQAAQSMADARSWESTGGSGPDLHPNVSRPPVVMLSGRGNAPVDLRRTLAGEEDEPMAAWEESLQELVRTRGTALVGYAYLLCGDRREAEDLVQDALVKTYARGRVGTHPDNVEGYVRRAILSTFLDGFRRRKRWAAVRHLVTTDDAAPGHEAAVEARMDVRAALDALSPRERACVVLRFYDDLTVARIADQLSLSEGAVKRYLSDGVHRMEALLGPVVASRARRDADGADDETAGDVDIHFTTNSRRTR